MRRWINSITLCPCQSNGIWTTDPCFMSVNRDGSDDRTLLASSATVTRSCDKMKQKKTQKPFSKGEITSACVSLANCQDVTNDYYLDEYYIVNFCFLIWLGVMCLPIRAHNFHGQTVVRPFVCTWGSWAVNVASDAGSARLSSFHINTGPINSAQTENTDTWDPDINGKTFLISKLWFIYSVIRSWSNG